MKSESMFKQYKRKIKALFPEAVIEGMPEPMPGADYYVSIRVSPENLEEAIELSSHLNYEFYTEQGVYIFGIVQEADTSVANAQA